MLFPPKRVLGISNAGCDCYLSDGHRLVQEARFLPDQVADFSAFISSRRSSVFVAMADQIEEDFRQDTIPTLRGPARGQLLARKSSQTYRDTPFHTSVSLGRETAGRRDERVLLMALTNAQVLNQWLTPLSTAGIRLAGLYSPPLAASVLLQAIARRSGAPPPRLLLVTINRAGLRQTLVDGKVARFSRLAAVAGDDAIDTPEFAANCIAEINKTQQYLVGLRLLQRDFKLPTLILVPPGQTPAWDRTDLFSESIEPLLIDLHDARQAAGLKALEAAGESPTMAAYADALWIHALAQRRPSLDFAPGWLREAYRMWQVRNALWAGGAAVLLAGCAFGAERWVDAGKLRREGDLVATQTRIDQLNYERIKRSFPPLPATPDQLKASVTAFEKMAARTVSPSPLLAEIGRVLEQVPEFRLDRLEWQQGSGADTAAPGGAAANAGGAADAQADVMEIAVLHGSLGPPGQAADPRRDLDSAERVAAALRAIRGASISIDKQPVDVTSASGLTGGDRAPVQAARRVALVSIRIARKVGS